jgi:hypothetical protein
VSKQLFKNFFFSSSDKYSKVVVISNEVLIQVFTQKEKKFFFLLQFSEEKTFNFQSYTFCKNWKENILSFYFGPKIYIFDNILVSKKIEKIFTK